MTCISTITGLYATFTPRTYFCSAYVTRVRVPLQCSLSVVFGAQFNCRRTVAFVLNHAFTMLHVFVGHWLAFCRLESAHKIT